MNQTTTRIRQSKPKICAMLGALVGLLAAMLIIGASEAMEFEQEVNNDD